jgi:outer membrane receptor for ferrienterochelin and colicins
MRIPRWNVMLSLLFATPLAAQTGSITGTVTDKSNAQPFAGAIVEARSSSGTVAGSTTSGANGSYRITGLPAGTYTVGARFIGFTAALAQNVVVASGGSATIDLGISPAVIQLDQVIVSASRRAEKMTDAPAMASVVPEVQITERPTLTITDHLKGLPGVDISQGGLVQSNVVGRGFNNIFSGATLMLIDNRFAAVPSLRVNVPAFFPAANEDIEKIEFVLGPGAALYGPNSAKGVLAITTRSPISAPGTTVGIESGFRSDSRQPDGATYDGGAGMVRTTLRSALRLSDKFGVKISGEYLKGTEWRMRDPAEPTTLPLAGQPAIPGLEPDACNAETGCRDFDLEKWNVDARVDVRPGPGTELIFNAGTTNAGSLIEYTGIGSAQARDWRYSYAQARFRWNNLFVQGFGNFSNAGDSFLFRSGQSIVDESRVYGAQVQHGVDIGSKETLLYGIDYAYTDARTDGTINGRNEADDDIREIGAYIHSTTRFSEKLDLVLALRWDDHSRLDDSHLSPRAAIVYKPSEDQSIRATFNRAFSTPSNNNLFLDILAARLPPPLPFNVRALGVPETGFHFRGYCGTGGVSDLCMRTNWPGAPTTALPAQAATLWPVARGIILQQIANNPALPGQVKAAVAAALNAMNPTATQVGTALRNLNTTSGTFEATTADAVADIGQLKAEISNAFELGYNAILSNKVRLSAAAWYERKENFVGPLIVESPNVFLDPASTTAFFANSPAWQALGTQLPPDLFAQLTGQVVGGMLIVPLATIVPDSPLTSTGDMFLTYRNFGKLDLWGTDLSFDYLFNDRWSISGMWSHVSDDFFSAEEVEGPTDVALNATSDKVAFTGRYRQGVYGIAAEAGVRYTKGFPVNSGVYVTELNSDGTRRAIPDWTVFDAQVSYRFKFGLMASLVAQNLFNENYATFVGIPQLGRLVLTKLQYEF